MKNLFYTISLTLILFSCQKNQFTESKESLHTIKLLQDGWIITNVSPEFQHQVSKKLSFRELLGVLVEKKHTTWNDFDENFRKFINKLEDPIEKSYFSQFVANYMFHNTFLLEETDSKSKNEAVGYYTNLLLENQSGDAELLFNGLYNLKDVWSKNEIIKHIDASQEFMAEHLKIYKEMNYDAQRQNNQSRSKSIDSKESARERLVADVKIKRDALHANYKERQLEAQNLLKIYKKSLLQ